MSQPPKLQSIEKRIAAGRRWEFVRHSGECGHDPNATRPCATCRLGGISASAALLATKIVKKRHEITGLPAAALPGKIYGHSRRFFRDFVVNFGTSLGKNIEVLRHEI
jgi:hypothetical protein